MISFGQLLMKDLGYNDQKTLENSPKWRKPEVLCAIMHTMVFEKSLIAPLLKCGIPVTVFKDRDKSDKGPLVERDPEHNLNYVH